MHDSAVSCAQPGTLFDWDIDVAQMQEMHDYLLSHPAFPSAARRLASNLIRETEDDEALRAMLRDVGHNLAAGAALYLEITGDLTLSSLKDYVGQFGLVSPGRVRSLLEHMRYVGYVEPVTDRPKKPMRFRATERFRASYRLHHANLLDAIALIEPDASRLIDHLGRRDIFDRLIIETTSGFATGTKQTPSLPDLYAVFLHRLAGILILHDLVARGAGFPPFEPIPFSVSATAERFAVSQMHVQRLKRAGVKRGLLVFEDGSITFTKSGQEALNWYYASRMFLNLRAAARTAQILDQA